MNRNYISLFCCVVVLFGASLRANAQKPLAWDGPVITVWQTDGHCAFTDMERFNGRYYITFREAQSHIFDSEGRAEGAIRILASTDGERWESVALLKKDTIDLRDPKLSVTPDGRLMVLMGGSIYVNKTLTACLPHVAFSSDGRQFSAPQEISIQASHPVGFDWLWRVTWQGRTGYGISYFRGEQGNNIALLKTKDGIHYKEVTPLAVEGSPNEATLRFMSDKTMQAMVRREGADKMGYWGTSRPPYKQWTWTPMAMRLGGPDFLYVGEQVVAGTRSYEKEVYGDYKTVLLKGTPDGRFETCMVVPSGGDTSYPRLLQVGSELWMCYYSSHKTESAAIYLVKIPLSKLGL